MKRSLTALGVGLLMLSGAPRAAVRPQSDQSDRSQTSQTSQTGRVQQRAAIPTPSDFLKMKIGGDGVLASYEQIVSYFKAIDPLSDRITVEDLGPTTMGHPMLNAVI